MEAEADARVTPPDSIEAFKSDSMSTHLFYVEDNKFTRDNTGIALIDDKAARIEAVERST